MKTRFGWLRVPALIFTLGLGLGIVVTPAPATMSADPIATLIARVRLDLTRVLRREPVHLQGRLAASVVKPWGEARPIFTGRSNLIVNAGETALRDCFIATSCVTAQAWKFHGIGTGAVAAAETDTGCGTELTTQYNPDSTRATGTQTNNGANVYRTVGTNTVDAAVTITEWCLMSQAATGGGTMWSRVVFAGIALSSGDSLQTTYDLTIE